jgi:hypothetical protein
LILCTALLTFRHVPAIITGQAVSDAVIKHASP